MRKSVSRRTFLKVLGAGAASTTVMSLTGCGSDGGSGGGNGGGNDDTNGGSTGPVGKFDTDQSNNLGGEDKEYGVTSDIGNPLECPTVDNVLFGYVGNEFAQIENTNKYKNKALVMAVFVVANGSENKTVDLVSNYSVIEKNFKKASNSEDVTPEEADDALDKIFAASRQSPYFVSRVGKTALVTACYGMNGTTGKDGSKIKSGEVGAAYIMMLAPADWKEITLQIKPSFRSDKFMDFSVKVSDGLDTSTAALNTPEL